MTGRRFGRLYVVKFDHQAGPSNTAWWLCRCDCGNYVVRSGRSLRNGETESCGCLRQENRQKTVGNKNYSKDYRRLYKIFIGMVHRCYDKNSISYSNYGAKGIYICDEWYDGDYSNVINFINWAYVNGYTDPKPGEPRNTQLTIDRKDVNGPYAPWNCRWISMKEQMNNKRNNRYIYDGGELLTFAQFEDKYHTRFTSERLRGGWSVSEIIFAAKHPELGMHKQRKYGNMLIDKDRMPHLIRIIPDAYVT